VLARPDTWRYRAAKFVRRNRVGVAATALAAAAALAGTAMIAARDREARRQRDAAQAQLARATAANEFLGFLMTVAAPSGRRISESDLLEKGEQLVDKQFADNDALHSEMLATIGERYLTADSYEKARSVLGRALTLARDPAVRAHALCPMALVQVATGDPRGAEASIREALARLPREPQYALQRAACLCRYSEFGFFTYEARPMIDHAREALEVLAAASVPSQPQRIDAQAALAYGYYLAGEYGRADRAYADLMNALDRAGRAQTMAAATVLTNWSLAHFDTDIVNAEPIGRRSVELHRAIEGDEGITPVVLANHAAMLTELDRYDEAEPEYLEAIRTARARSDRQVELQALLEVADLYSRRGETQKAVARIAEAERAYRNTPLFSARERANAAYSRGLAALAQGNANESRARFQECVAIYGKMESKFNQNVSALIGLAQAEQALGHSSEAEAAARQAVALAESIVPKETPSYLIARSRTELAEIELARGDHEARAALSSAADMLAKTLGPGHPETIAARRLAESATSER
jgi:serine/threonine-protein kinase